MEEYESEAIYRRFQELNNQAIREIARTSEGVLNRNIMPSVIAHFSARLAIVEMEIFMKIKKEHREFIKEMQK